MNGPFFCERMLLTLSLHDELFSSFVVSRLVAQRRLAPWRHRVISLHAAFTTAVRMVDGIHHDTAVGRADAHMPRASGFADGDIFVVQISDLADRRAAVDIHQPDFAGRKFYVSIP